MVGMSLVSTPFRPLCGVSGCRRRPVLCSVVALFLMASFGTYVRFQSGSGIVPDTARKMSGFKYGVIGDEETRLDEVMEEIRPGEGDGTYRYLISLNYWEQFSNALRNYLSLSCVADEWIVRVVRPYTIHSRFYGLPNLFLDEHFNQSQGEPPANELSLILDPNSLDSVLHRAKIRYSATLDEMLKFGDRKLIFIHFVSVISHKEYSIKSSEILSSLSTAFQKSNIMDCIEEKELLSLARLVSSNLNSRLTESESRRPFYPYKYVCVNASQGLNPFEFSKSLNLNDGNVSLVVINWRGVGNSSNIIHSSTGVHPNKRIGIDSRRCLDRRNKPKFSNIRFSQIVLKSSEKFMMELGVEENKFIAVHFRSEKLTFRESRFPRLLANCVSEALKKKDELLEKVGVAGGRGHKVLYFADVGDFGTDTCKSCASVKVVENLAKKYHFSLTHFSPLTYDLPADRGLAAAVEMSVMSRASHVILVGGGSFEGNLQMRYNARQQIRYKSQRKAIMLCSTDQQARRTTRKYSPPPH